MSVRSLKKLSFLQYFGICQFSSFIAKAAYCQPPVFPHFLLLFHLPNLSFLPVALSVQFSPHSPPPPTPPIVNGTELKRAQRWLANISFETPPFLAHLGRLPPPFLTPRQMHFHFHFHSPSIVHSHFPCPHSPFSSTLAIANRTSGASSSFHFHSASSFALFPHISRKFSKFPFNSLGRIEGKKRKELRGEALNGGGGGASFGEKTMKPSTVVFRFALRKLAALAHCSGPSEEGRVDGVWIFSFPRWNEP